MGPENGSRRSWAPTDSIGIEIRGGQRFVKHRVGPGETLSALSRRYRVTLSQLLAANPQVNSGLAVGQVVLVPRPVVAKAATSSPAAAKAPAVAAAPADAVPARYTVAKGETLFGIARRYQLTPEELILLNKLPSNGSVRVGQQLILTAATGAAAAATAEEAAPAPKVSVAPDKPAQIATVTPAAPAEEKEEAAREERTPTRASEVLARVVENGLGAPIDKSVTDKYLALHKTAAVGTIMQVKNNMNGLSVYVRVIGKLPDTGENNNILVRLSPRAMQKLGTGDSRFRVETNYIPQ
ncbi:hypothetical protein BEN48_10050 [Hymenobacter glacialis]|uniref:LysM domain-containing protein n=1 Tax=Hymenobacter glacialis TaxID=1908236 RepID=A0A1G1TBH4_9BACT|nr:hypothetical protein BEN48_10050 [Hymenobacter glacialis]